MSDTVGDLNVCSDASNSSWEDVEDEETLTGDDTEMHLENSLLMNSLILEKIFEFLPVKELQECRFVCKEWNKTALLRRLIGSKVEIRVTNGNFDKLLRIALNSLQPFCRKFNFHLVQLDIEKVLKFVKYFGERISSLSLRCCTTSSKESVIELLNCPRLEELTVVGALPPIEEENFHRFLFTRLKVLSFNSSIDYSQVSKEFIRIVLKRSPNLQKIRIGYRISLWKDFCSEVTVAALPKLCEVEFIEIDAPLEKDLFQGFLAKKLIPRKILIRSCLVGQDFFEQLLLQTYQHLLVLHIVGTQQEILTKAFSAITLPNIKEISLPIDGIGRSEGNYILQSCPRLQVLKVTGLFQTIFEFQDGTLISVSVKETFSTSSFMLLSNTIVYEKQKEFLKVLSLISLQPKKLTIDLPDLNSRCLRNIYARYPNLEDFCLVHNSIRECIVGMTGIPYRIYKKIAHCKSFSVVATNKFNFLPSISKLTSLKRFELSFVGDIPSTELTLVLLVYGICGVNSLEKLILKNFTISDVSLMSLAQKLKLSVCEIDDSSEKWDRFQSFYKEHTIKSFLLPPSAQTHLNVSGHLVGMNSQFLVKVFDHLDSADVFEARKVCNYWHSLSSDYLHGSCEKEKLTGELEKRLSRYLEDKSSPPSPSSRTLSSFRHKQTPNLPKVLQMWSSIRQETTLAIVTLNKSTLERFQKDFNHRGALNRNVTCQQRKMLEYWYYPDGSDELVCRPALQQELLVDLNASKLSSTDTDTTTLLTIGCWGRKDDGLLEFLNPSWSLSTIHLVGLQKEAFDIVLPKLTQMINLESLHVKPTVHTTTYCELTKTHLQILCNAAFNLKSLRIKGCSAPSEAVVEFVRSQRFTLETLEVQSLVNISDRLTFSIPQLRILQLDEPPGCLLWATLNMHSSLKTIGFGRSGTTCSQIKNKSPKMNLLESDFEHSATEILCDVNWFLENAITRNGTKVQKSILQQGSDSALKFFTHFPYLSSLTLRGVHAHYGILQGIFRKFPQLKKLELISATGVTDEILTGFSKEILDEMDIMNPFQVRRERHRTEVKGKGSSSVRNLKCLTHLIIDDQPSCTDFAVIFGLLKLSQLQYLSCRKWKISDISIRALADILPSLKEINTNGCSNVSKYALEYFKESRIQRRCKQIID